jgi:serine/threonine-protein kinase RsbW
MNLIRLQIPSHADYLDVVRLCLYGIASQIGFSYEDIDDMKVAVTEACSNAVLYADTNDSLGMIDISFKLEEASLGINVKDNGHGFNYKQALDQAKPFNNEEISELCTEGVGIYLIQALMDEVDIHMEDGIEVIMKKYVTAKNPLDGVKP